jgi:hypothetical protein
MLECGRLSRRRAGGWRDEVGERVRTAEGWATVEAMARWWGQATVHNLEVEAQHRFLAGAAGVVSHNAGGGGGGGSCGGESCGAPNGPKKRGPKPKGEGPHNKKIEEEAKRLSDAGNTIESGGGGTEEVIKTRGGQKQSRRPDIVYRTPSGERRGVNVGKTMKDGRPVPRERSALDDLNRYGGLPTTFVPYDR